MVPMSGFSFAITAPHHYALTELGRYICDIIKLELEVVDMGFYFSISALIIILLFILNLFIISNLLVSLSIVKR